MKKQDYNSIYPPQEGNLDVYPVLVDNNQIAVNIFGDKKGFYYLADLFRNIADYKGVESEDEECNYDLHVHLHRYDQIGESSCEIAIYRKK